MADTITADPGTAGAARTSTVPRSYQARPGRRAVVVASLADLRGPAEGTVELPIWLFWGNPDHTFDLGDKDMRRWLYQTVLREASQPEDLAAYDIDMAAYFLGNWSDLATFEHQVID